MLFNIIDLIKKLKFQQSILLIICALEISVRTYFFISFSNDMLIHTVLSDEIRIFINIDLILKILSKLSIIMLSVK